MAAPTLSDFQTANFTDTATTETTASVTWSAGDVVVVVGVTEDNGVTLAVPAVTGLTFTQVTVTNTASNCKVYIWSATAAGSGSGAITSTNSSQGGNGRGIAAFVFSGSDGVGASALMAATTTTNPTQALTRTQANSAVIVAMGDWAPVNDTTVTTNPSTGGTVRVIQFDTGQYAAYVGSWADEGAIGTTSYGIGDYTATPQWIGAVVEIKGTAGGGPTVYYSSQSLPLMGVQ